METITSIQALKRFFEADGGRKIDMKEFQALSSDERKELAELACKQMGCELSGPAS